MEIRKIITTILLVLALIIISTTTSAAISCNCGDICVDETGWWRDGGALNVITTPIQAAVDNASSGETICIKAGSYTENVDIATPHLTLRGEGAGEVTVNVTSISDHAFKVTANYVNISGFNATGATDFPHAGIYLDGVDHCNISENTVSNNYHGIDLYSSSNNTLTNNTALNNRAGIYMYSSSNNKLTRNTPSNNYYGIDLYSSSNNTLTSNTASNNNSCGIYLSYSSNYNTLTNNTASNNNSYGICLSSSSNNTLTSNIASLNKYDGIQLYSLSNNNTLTGNNCSNNNRGIYLGDSSNNTLVNNTASNNYYGIDLYSSNNYNTLANNTASNNTHGIYLRYSSNYNTLTNNTASNNWDGIYLYSSSNYNTLTNNTASNNNRGIYLYSSSNNTITSNTASSNDYNGIYVHYSSNNTLMSNTASSNDYDGIHLYSSSNNTASNNTASNNMRGIYLYSSNNNTLTNNTADLNRDHGIYLHKSSNNTLTSNIANLNDNNGIYLYLSSNYNMLTNNIANSNNYGIYLYSSSNNTLASNTANSNNNRGIYLSSSSDNLIYNNYFNNTNNAYDGSSNQWNTTKTSGTNILGGPFLGGNYWSDYAGVDNDGDGLGDTLTPYNSSDDIESVGDYHPLVMLDNTPPSGITYLQNITHARTYINWTWTDPVDSDFSKVMVYLDGVFQDNVTIGVQCYNATSLTSGTAYEIGTRTVDTTGDINLTWVNHTATTASTSDNTAPVINSVTLDPADPNTGDDISVTVNVTDNVGVTAVTADGVSLSNADGNDTWKGTITAIEGTHTVNISASDAAGNTAYETANYTATTPVPTLPVVLVEDVTAAPNGYAFTSVMVKNVTGLGSGSITVTYNTSVVHVTNVTSGDGNGNALAVQGWNIDNSTGSVEIAAWDADESHNGDVVFAQVTFYAVGEYPDSTPLVISSSELIDYTSYGIIGHSVTNGTFSIIDNEPPVITDAIATLDVILNDNGRPRVPGTNVTVLNATVLDIGHGVVNVTIDLSSIGGSDDQVMERIAGTDIWTVATAATEGINLTHELVVTATDGANNTNTSVIELTVLLRGDIVRDGDLNSADALYIAKYLVGKEPMPSLLVSDISPAEGDGKITSADALYLAKYLVGKEAAP